MLIKMKINHEDQIKKAAGLYWLGKSKGEITQELEIPLKCLWEWMSTAQWHDEINRLDQLKHKIFAKQIQEECQLWKENLIAAQENQSRLHKAQANCAIEGLEISRVWLAQIRDKIQAGQTLTPDEMQLLNVIPSLWNAAANLATAATNSERLLLEIDELTCRLNSES